VVLLLLDQLSSGLLKFLRECGPLPLELVVLHLVLHVLGDAAREDLGLAMVRQMRLADFNLLGEGDLLLCTHQFILLRGWLVDCIPSIEVDNFCIRLTLAVKGAVGADGRGRLP
jgi:hypothetical protein